MAILIMQGQGMMPCWQLRKRLNAQVQAIPLYKNFGFEIEGEEFMEANIPHRKMTLRL